jgi:hypothetical protein
VVDMSNCSDIQMRLSPLEFRLCHAQFPSGYLSARYLCFSL